MTNGNRSLDPHAWRRDIAVRIITVGAAQAETVGVATIRSNRVFWEVPNSAT